MKALPRLALVGVLLQTQAMAATHLLLVGGGSRPKQALQRFVDWSGGPDSRILIIGWASNVPGDYIRSLSAEFSALGVPSVLASETAPVNEAGKERFLSLLKRATGVFFTGGDQNRAMAAIDSWGLKSPLWGQFMSGVPFGGTSAGTALMAETMITGRGAPQTSVGLGFFKPAVIDMHFLKRNREPRLIAAMESAQVPFGIGVDEDGALAIEDSLTAEVLGAPRVIFYESRAGRTLRFELSEGDRFDLRSWEPAR